MFKFIKNLFIDKKSDTLKNNSNYQDKKSKFTTEEPVAESGFFIHKIPKATHKEDKMPSHIEMHDNINNQQFEVIDQKTGKVMMIDSSQAQGHMEQIPPGVNIPGIGPVGGAPRRQPQQQRPPQQMQQPHPQQMQQHPQQMQQPYPQQMQQPYPQQMQQPYPQQMQQPYPQQAPMYSDAYAGNVPSMHTTPIPVMPLPASEMVATDDAYYLWIDLPGVKKEDIRLSYGNGALTVSGIRESNGNALKRELILAMQESPKTRGKELITQDSNTVPAFLMSEFTFVYPFKKLIDETSIAPKIIDGVLYIKMNHRVVGDEIVIAIM